MTNTEIVRSVSADIPVNLIIVVRNNVKKVKLVINPVTTPRGLFLPPVRVPDSTIGRIGRMHGERIVTMPPINAKNNKSSITYYYTYLK
jgi:hypothetical protein